MMKVNNLPQNTREFIVARRDSNWEFWYWDSYTDRNRANQAALEIGGEVFTKECLE